MEVIELWLLSLRFSADASHVLAIVGVILLLMASCLLLYYFLRFGVMRILTLAITNRKVTLTRALIKHKFINRLCSFIFFIALRVMMQDVFATHPSVLGGVSKLIDLLIILHVILLVFSTSSAFAAFYSVRSKHKRRPIKGIIQFVQVIVGFIGGVFMMSILLDKSPGVFLGGLGAVSAILLLVFRDAILGVVAGIQLAVNDIIRIGDWITMEKFGADGIVVDILLTTVKVQNFDRTIIAIPAYNLISDSVKNWRGMKEAGGRRISRAIYIDIHTIKFCSPAMQDRLAGKSIGCTEGQTNLSILRMYIDRYLRNHPHILQNMPVIVRQLPPTDGGLPLQIYCFTNTSDWIVYEEIQAAIFEHLLSVVPFFELGVYQRSGARDARMDDIQVDSYVL